MSDVPSTPSRRQNRLQVVITLGSLVLIVVGCFLAATVGPALMARLFPAFGFLYTGEIPISVETAKSSGPSRPFAELWDVAQKKVMSIDSEAILRYVRAAPVGYFAGVPYPGPDTGSLEMSFEYVRPDGRDISIQFEDADPESTLSTRSFNDEPSPDYEWRYLDSRESLPEMERRLRAYKLSPRDAVAHTWDDAQAYAKKNGLQPEHVLPLVTTTRTKEGHSAWSVDYWYKLPRESFSLSELFEMGGGGVVYFTVDGETGEIVRQEYQTIEPTHTPSP